MVKRICIVAAVVATLVFLLSACQSAPAKPESAVPQEFSDALDLPAGISGLWYIVDADGWIPAEDGLNVPALFIDDAEGYAGVATGLNSMMTGLQLDMGNHSLSFDCDGPMTLVAGSDHAMHFEAALLNALPRVSSFVLDPSGRVLYVFDAEENLLMVLER